MSRFATDADLANCPECKGKRWVRGLWGFPSPCPHCTVPKGCRMSRYDYVLKEEAARKFQESRRSRP